MRKKFATISIIFFLISWTGPVFAAGSAFYFSPSSSSAALGGTFDVSVRLDSGGQFVNATEGTVLYDKELLQATNVSSANSILSMWYTKPAFDNSAGSVVWGGGLPNPGYKGASGNLFTITFKPLKVGSARLFFSSGAALANDGLGTNVLSSMGSANFTISPKLETSEPSSQPDSTVGSDSQPELDTMNPLSIRSARYPDQTIWYRGHEADFSWEAASDTSVKIGFDNSINGEAVTRLENGATSTTIKDIKDGVWYFHLSLQEKGGSWTPASTFRIQIDNAPPEALDITEKFSQEDWPSLFLKAADKSSGILRYEINVSSLEEQAHVIEGAEGEIKIKDVNPGEHIAMIKVVDKAGNEYYTAVKFDIKPIERPIIKNYLEIVKTTDSMFMSGTSLPGARISIYLQKDNIIQSRQAQADASGNWHYISEDKLAPGRYLAWAEALNQNGLKSEPTEKISFLVSPPAYVAIGQFVTNYLSVIVSVLFLCIAIIALCTYLFLAIRKRLRQETYEVEKVIDKNISDLKDHVDHELAGLNQYVGKPEFKREKAKVHLRLNKHLDSSKSKMMKEVQDVEDILK